MILLSDLLRLIYRNLPPLTSRLKKKTEFSHFLYTMPPRFRGSLYELSPCLISGNAVRTVPIHFIPQIDPPSVPFLHSHFMLKRAVCAFFHKHSLHIQRPDSVSVFLTFYNFREGLELLYTVPGTDGLPGIYSLLPVIPGIYLQVFRRKIKICPYNIFKFLFRNPVSSRISSHTGNQTDH